ncbi:MAG: YihA family ribosome biogenesis GTP-binding protein [Acidobacteria bacterium]|nr:YihA family ribosome biogenesis GTP-binding protein [Acidobacteriota bacterium]
MKISEAIFVSGAVDLQGYPKDGRKEIAFIGRSNVGKSSLLNSLLGQKLARTSNTPGRTQQINFFLVNKQFYFVDLPGYGFAKLSKKERENLLVIVEKYLAQRSELVLSILLIDSRHLPTEFDLKMKSWLEEIGRPFLIVLTKSDKLSNNELSNQTRKIKLALGVQEVIPYSSITSLGRDSLWKAILAQISDGKA